MKEIVAKFNGTTPLMMHNGRLKNPLDEYAKALKKLTSKRNKTDSDHLEISRLEWEGGLYFKDGVIGVPGKCIDATLEQAAKKSKNGRNWKQGAIVLDDFCPLDYKGEKIKTNGHTEIPNPSLDKFYPMYKNIEMKNIKKIGVLRTRPIFNSWSFTCTIAYDETVFDERTVTNIMQTAGRYIGFLEERPRFGQAEVEFVS